MVCRHTNLPTNQPKPRRAKIARNTAHKISNSMLKSFLTKELEAFDAIFRAPVYPEAEAIRADIKSFLKQSHSRLIHAITEEVKGKKKPELEYAADDETNQNREYFGYNAALSEIEKLLEQYQEK